MATTTSPFGGGGRRCSLCFCLLPTTRVEQAYLLPTFLRQLVALVGFDVVLPLCDGCHGDVISVIDILRQVDKLQRALRRNVEGIRDKKKVAGELVGPLLTVEDNVAMPTEQSQVIAEFVVENPPQTVVASSQPVLTLSTGDYYLGSVPFTPTTTTTTTTPYQNHNYQEPTQQNNSYQPPDVQTGHQDDDMGGDDAEYFPPNDDNESSDSDKDEVPTRQAVSTPTAPPPPVTPTCTAPPRRNANEKSRKIRKCPARWTLEQKAIILAKRRAAQVEVFGPFETTPKGRLYFEGVEIIKVGDSYSCSACDWSADNMAIVDMENCPGWKKAKAIKLHVRGVHSRSYRCDKCDKNFSCARALEKHLPTKFHAENNPTTCPICAMTVPKFKLDSHLFSHKTPAEQDAELAARPRKKGRKGANNQEPTGQEEIDPNTGLKLARRLLIRHPRPKTPCAICGRPTSPLYMAAHIWSHKSESEKETALKFGLAPKLPPKPTLPLPKLQCPICSKFVWKDYLSDHVEIHKAPQDRPSFPCVQDGCTYVAKRKAMLAMHVRGVHEKHKRTWQFCTVAGCTGKFMTRRGLKYHLDTSHGNNLKKTPCPLCNVKFFRLKEHTKRHGPVEEYTFLCPHCPFKFNREKWLKKHLVKDHGETVVWKPRYVKKTVRKKYKKREKKTEGSGLKNVRIPKKLTKTTPVLRLHRLPAQLLTGTEIKVISDQVVSLVGSRGGFEIVVLSSD